MGWQDIKGGLFRHAGLAEFAAGDARNYRSSEDYAQLRPLEGRWQSIRDEARALVVDQFVEYYDASINRTTWRNFPLVYGGRWIAPNLAACPTTAETLRQVPGVTLAVFAVLPAHSALAPHRGNPCGTLRAHMGLSVPPNARFVVNGEVRHWEHGRFFVFNETYLHTAINDSDEDRLVLIVDFLEDPLNWPLWQRAVFAAEYARHYTEFAVGNLQRGRMPLIVRGDDTGRDLPLH
jgi:aspartyl/asparaginyl beta-hydroxylase (cupin superfamily)